MPDQPDHRRPPRRRQPDPEVVEGLEVELDEETSERLDAIAAVPEDVFELAKVSGFASDELPKILEELGREHEATLRAQLLLTGIRAREGIAALESKMTAEFANLRTELATLRAELTHGRAPSSPDALKALAPQAVTAPPSSAAPDSGPIVDELKSIMLTLKELVSAIKQR